MKRIGVLEAAALLAVAASTLAIVFPILKALGAPGLLTHADLLLAIPAILLGGWVWASRPGVRSAWPLTLAAVLVLASLLWVADTERLRGVSVFLHFVIPLPLAALLVRVNGAHRAMKAFVALTLVVLAVSLVGSRMLSGGPDLLQLGTVRDGSGTALTNRNQFATQLGLASLFALRLAQVDASGARSPRDPSPGAVAFHRASAFTFGLAVVFTSSRTQALALVAGIVFLVLSTPRPRRGVPVPVALACLLGAGVAAPLAITGLAGGPLPLLDRFSEADDITDLNGRVDIWSRGLTAWVSDPRSLLMGAGTGGVDAFLGSVDEEPDVHEDGVLRKAPHNLIVEWLLSYGLLGILPGAAAFLWVLSGAWRMDRTTGAGERLAILLFITLASLSSTFYRHPFWIAAASILIALLYTVHGRGHPRPRPRPARSGTTRGA